jgi:hypothetical protein
MSTQKTVFLQAQMKGPLKSGVQLNVFLNTDACHVQKEQARRRWI